MAKMYRREIRIKGVKYKSPWFSRKKDADDWYDQMRRKKQFMRDGFVLHDESNIPTMIEYCQKWMAKRMKSYPMATWKADEQRLRTYVLPVIAEMPINLVTTGQIKALLVDMTDNGLSVNTRTRVRALLSTIFNSALNEDPPVVKFNPVTGIRFDEKRMGTKKPSFIRDPDQCLAYLKTAKEKGRIYLLIASVVMMSALRKSELLALTWSSIDFKNKQIRVSERVEQASLQVRPGTKRGENVTRVVPVPDELINILQDYRAHSKFKEDSDYIFARDSDGRFMNPREVWALNHEIVEASGIKVTVHGLRHTYGREFAARSGNMKALQAILGHSSSSTTDIYSDLSGKRIEGFGGVVGFNLDEKK